MCVCVCVHRSYLQASPSLLKRQCFHVSVICFLIIPQVNLPAFLQKILEFLKYSTNLMKLELFTSGENLTVSKNRKWFLSISRDALNGPSLPVFTVNAALPSPFLFTFFVCFPRKNSEALSQLLRLENLLYSWFLPVSHFLFQSVYDVYQLYIQSESSKPSFFLSTMSDALVWTRLISF